MSSHECFVESGAIVDGSGRVIYAGVPVAKKYIDDHTDINPYRAFQCLEGVVIYVFNHDGAWITSTSRSIDAYATRWASKRESFGTAFDRIYREQNPDGPMLYDLLDSDRLYAFLLISRDERIVCDVADEDIVFLGCSMRDGRFEHAIDLDCLPQLTRRREYSRFDRIDDVVEYVAKYVDSSKEQGVVLMTDTAAIKIVSPEYKTKRDVRGYTPSLRHRYLELRGTRFVDLPIFFSINPEMKWVAERIEEQIYELAKHLHSIYMRIFVKNETSLRCSKEEYHVLNKIHKLYMTTKQRTVPTRINDVLANIHPSKLNRLLREMPITKCHMDQNSDGRNTP